MMTDEQIEAVWAGLGYRTKFTGYLREFAHAILAAPRQPGKMGAGVQQDNTKWNCHCGNANCAGLHPNDASAQQDEREAGEPPLGGRWHHGNGVVVCGTLRIFGEDFDTDPAPEFKEQLLTWVCDTLNAAQDRAAQQVQADAGVVAMLSPDKKAVYWLIEPPKVEATRAHWQAHWNPIYTRPAAESDKRGMQVVVTPTDAETIAEMTKLVPWWNTKGRSRESAVRLALEAYRHLAAMSREQSGGEPK